MTFTATGAWTERMKKGSERPEEEQQSTSGARKSRGALREANFAALNLLLTCIRVSYR